MKRGFDNFGAMDKISKSNDFEFFNITTTSARDAEKNKLILKLPYSYQRVLTEPFYSEYFPTATDKSTISNDLTQVAVDSTLTPDEKILQAMALIEAKVPSLAPEFDPNAITDVDDSLRADTSGGNFIVDNKWWFIGGGILIVGGIATWLILRRR
jgi:hypothetical protein